MDLTINEDYFKNKSIVSTSAIMEGEKYNEVIYDLGEKSSAVFEESGESFANICNYVCIVSGLSSAIKYIQTSKERIHMYYNKSLDDIKVIEQFLSVLSTQLEAYDKVKHNTLFSSGLVTYPVALNGNIKECIYTKTAVISSFTFVVSSHYVNEVLKGSKLDLFKKIFKDSLKLNSSLKRRVSFSKNNSNETLIKITEFEISNIEERAYSYSILVSSLIMSLRGINRM